MHIHYEIAFFAPNEPFYAKKPTTISTCLEAITSVYSIMTQVIALLKQTAFLLVLTIP